MTLRHIHYEAAFEDYLRSRGIPYVPVDETRRVIFAGTKVKSFDFLVYPSENQRWIVDIKGRKFPYLTSNGGKCYWENWVTRADLEGMSEWQTVFGDKFEARFAFTYLLEGPPDRWPSLRPHSFRGDYYAFFTVSLPDYQKHCRQRSPSWETVSVARKTFRSIAQPFDVCAKPQLQPQ